MHQFLLVIISTDHYGHLMMLNTGLKSTSWSTIQQITSVLLERS